MSFIWNDLLIKPLLNLLIFLHNVIPTHDLGLVIILITLIIRLCLLPLSLKSSRAQKKLKDVMPQLNEMKEKHKGDQKALAQAQMDFYRQNKISPMGSCLPILIQFPILIALYQVLREGLTTINPDLVYSFITLPETINHTFLGFLDLSKPDKYFLPIIAGVFQFYLGFLTTPPASKSKGGSPEQAMTRQMMYMMPLLTVFLGMSVPAGLTIYWVATTLFSVVQQIIVNKEKGKEIKVKIKKANHEQVVEFIEQLPSEGEKVAEKNIIEGEYEQENQESHEGEKRE